MPVSTAHLHAQHDGSLRVAVLPAQIVENCEQRLSIEQQESLLSVVQKHLSQKAV